MPIEWEPWLQAMKLPLLEPAARLSFSTYTDVIAAALAGQGVALGRRPLIDELLRRRELVAPLGTPLGTPRSYILVVDPAARMRASVRAFEAWLLAQAATDREAATNDALKALPAQKRGKRA